MFQRIFKEYNQQVLNYLAVKVNGNMDLAEEIFSDTFHSAIISAPMLKDINKVLSWLLRIANRRFIDFLRKKYREKKFTTGNDDYHQVADDYDLTEKVLESEKVVMMNHAIENLPPKYKNLIQYKYKENKTTAEISKIIDKSEKSVESLLYRARDQLKKELERSSRGLL
ncbi:MAG: sigma-70 family RNA polymerase sigma factor [Spirochaetes bacterium]|nr:sigma-70 family RNA polymerase sigma factor [Spirochaetota bacterium]